MNGAEHLVEVEVGAAEPDEVTRMITSVGSSIVGSGTVSTRDVPLAVPCHCPHRAPLASLRFQYPRMPTHGELNGAGDRCVSVRFAAPRRGRPIVLPRSKGPPVILRIDRLQTELPPPSDPDPAGAAAVQELLGGKFGEMSTFMNYTFQSFNFRNRQGARPFFDLVANIAAEEFGHVELVATTINTMLTGATPETPRTPSGALAHVKGAATCTTSSRAGRARCARTPWPPWNGNYVFSSGDLVEDLTHNFFLETGARNNKLKVYEMVDHPPRARSPATCWSAAASTRSPTPRVEHLTGADLMKLFPSPRIPTDKIPESKPHIDARRAPQAVPLLAHDYRSSPPSSTAPTRSPASSSWSSTTPPEGAPAHDLPAQPAVFAPDYAPEEIAEIARKLRKQAGLPGADRRRRGRVGRHARGARSQHALKPGGVPPRTRSVVSGRHGRVETRAVRATRARRREELDGECLALFARIKRPDATHPFSRNLGGGAAGLARIG